MNAFAPVASLSVRAADLADRAERLRIDRFLEDSAAAELFHRPEWSLAAERGCRQRAHFLLAETKAGDIAGLLPLTEMRSPLFGSALVSAGFGVGGGILSGGPEATAALADAAWTLAENSRLPVDRAPRRRRARRLGRAIRHLCLLRSRSCRRR
jgi:hypothetical protein